MLTVDSLRARAARLQQLNLGLAEEVARWKGAGSPLLDSERQAYLKEIQGGITGFDAAWHALTTAIQRIEEAGEVRREGAARLPESPQSDKTYAGSSGASAKAVPNGRRI